MKKVSFKILAGLILVAFLCPPVFGQEAGDKIAGVFFKEVKPPTDLIPAGARVSKGFKPGPGKMIGKVQMMQGQALLGHPNAGVFYQVRRNFPLVSGDTLVTGEKSRVQALLNDKSSVSVAPYSKLTLTKVIYDPTKDERATTLSLAFGRARSTVTKLKNSYNNDYQVETPTAICGVRGSDFALSVIPREEHTAFAPNWWDRFFAAISPVKEAHAFNGPLVTTVLTGPGTTVNFGGQIVGPFSASYALPGMAPISPLPVSPSLVTGGLNASGPGLAVMGMPPEFD